MTLVVFGASGATGRHVLAVARASGLDVRAVVRAGASASVP